MRGALQSQTLWPYASPTATIADRAGQVFFGQPPRVGAQDQAITESQQPIVDRTQERLGRADLGIIRVRQWLLDAAVALGDRGTLPPSMDPASFRIRPASVLLPKEVPWVEGSQERLVARMTSPPSLT